VLSSLHPTQTQEKIVEKRTLIASWLFLIGSALFMMDAISEIVNHFSPAALVHLSEGVLFVVGSLFFMPASSDSTQQEVN
jgi:hypothetical protein